MIWNLFNHPRHLIAAYKSLLWVSSVILVSSLCLVGAMARFYLAYRYRAWQHYVDLLILLTLFFVCLFLVRSKKILQRRFSNQSFVWLLAAGLLLRMLVGFHDIYNRPTPVSDYRKFEILGQRLAFEKKYWDFVTPSGVELRAYRPPGLPMILASMYWVSSNGFPLSTEHVPLVVMFSFSIGTLIASFILVSRTRNLAAFVFFLYISVSPSMLLMASSTNSQLPFFFAILLVLLVMQSEKLDSKKAFLIGLFLGVSSLIRSNGLLFLPALVIYLLEKERLNFNRTIGRLGFASAGLIVTLLPWAIRNYLILGAPVLLATTSGANMYVANVVTDVRNAGGYYTIPDNVYLKYPNQSEVELSNSFSKEVLAFIIANPIHYLESLPYRVMKYMGDQEWSIQHFFQESSPKYPQAIHDLSQRVENLLTWTVFLLGLLLLVRSRDCGLPEGNFVLLSYLIYSVIDLLLFESRDRYHFPYLLFPMLSATLCSTEVDDSGDLNALR